MRFVAIILALLLGTAEARAQVLQPSAFSQREVATHVTNESAPRRSPLSMPGLVTDPLLGPPTRQLRARPIVIGAVAGALLGAGGGMVLGGTCERTVPECPRRRIMVTGAIVGAAIGSLFGLLLALPPRGAQE